MTNENADIDSIMKLDVPIIVQVSERSMLLDELITCAPGSIIELPKSADEELSVLVNNVEIGRGTAVKVGENFGLKLTYVGDLRSKIEAMGGFSSLDEPDESESMVDDDMAAMLAAQMLDGQ